MESQPIIFQSCGSAANGCLLYEISDPEDDSLSFKTCNFASNFDADVNIVAGVKHCVAVQGDDVYLWGETIDPTEENDGNISNKDKII